MLGRLARGAYVLFVAAMIAAWAISAGKGVASAQPQSENTVVTWWC